MLTKITHLLKKKSRSANIDININTYLLYWAHLHTHEVRSPDAEAQARVQWKKPPPIVTLTKGWNSLLQSPPNLDDRKQLPWQRLPRKWGFGECPHRPGDSQLWFQLVPATTLWEGHHYSYRRPKKADNSDMLQMQNVTDWTCKHGSQAPLPFLPYHTNLPVTTRVHFPLDTYCSS